MKKLGAVILILALGMTACSNHTDGKDNTTSEQNTTQNSTDSQTSSSISMPESLIDQVDSYVMSGGTETELGDGVGQQTDDSGGQTTEVSLGDDGTTDGQAAGSSVADGTESFEERDDTVYATANVVVRNKPSTSGDPVMNLKQGNSVHRVGYGTDWTKVEVNGYFYYIATRYLSETQWKNTDD